ncbi:MAG: 8-amino-7-oxononanoate synthase [Deltaproteobacteria bacterium]|nr:8-amino-7-oxononanoate synthase [Deltaproteobacteria bacterium]
MDFLTKELENLKASGLYRTLRTIEGPQGPRVKIDGKDVVLLCSNNYLGIADHPRLKEAAIKAIERYGVGSGASRLVSGTMKLHEELEERIARFKGTEAALVFNSGYTANTSVIPALVWHGDIVFSDRLNHASIIDGCALSRAELKRYPHKDVEGLERLLKVVSGQWPVVGNNVSRLTSHISRQLIVTDSVFSMDGDIAPLPEIVTLAKKYGAMVMVDDAHATGVLGKTGKGSLEHFGLECEENIIQMGTLGKALGTFGAYIAGSRELIDYLTNKARGFIFSTSLPPFVLASAIAAIDLVEDEPELRQALWKKTWYLKKWLDSMGFDTMGSETPIIPVFIGDTGKTMEFSRRLLEEGVFVSGIRPPTVPEGKSRLRATVMANHSYDDLDMALDAFSKVGRELCLIS